MLRRRLKNVLKSLQQRCLSTGMMVWYFSSGSWNKDHTAAGSFKYVWAFRGHQVFLMPFSAKQLILINIKKKLSEVSWIQDFLFLWRGFICSFQSIGVTRESLEKIIVNFFCKCVGLNLSSLLENQDTN